MSDFLFNLATRALGEPPDVVPRLPSLFESPVLDAEPPAHQIGTRGLEPFDVSSEEESIAPPARLTRNRARPETETQSTRVGSVDQLSETDWASSKAGSLVPSPTKLTVRNADRGHDEHEEKSLMDARPPLPVVTHSEQEQREHDPIRGELSITPTSEPRVSIAAARTEKAADTGASIRPPNPGRRQDLLPQVDLPRIKPTAQKDRVDEIPARETKPKVKRGVLSPQPSPSTDLPRHRSPQPESQSVSEQVINVTIGRIEVRATNGAAGGVMPAARNRPSVMSLDDYLHRRKGSNTGGGR